MTPNMPPNADRKPRHAREAAYLHRLERALRQQALTGAQRGALRP